MSTRNRTPRRWSALRSLNSGPVSRRFVLRITFAVAADDAGGVGPGSTYRYAFIHQPSPEYR
ncbi:hypothetical protein [Saccharopolyspora rosea]|uniref:Uncharacterized protein n=1 Tax=Saccharopolyspora rosea TaxID=524884 RepID=A0ABW3G520_9PSEU|nr:hypothetical protein [Saccharopolyspora rosea]